VTGTTTHQPFNPIEGKINIPTPIYEEQQVYTQDSLDPNQNLTYNTQLVDGEGGFPGDKGMIYHDPFLMLALVFTHKTATGTWAGGAATYGQLTGDFTDVDDEDTIMLQTKTVDAAGTVIEEKTYLGVKATEFSIGFKKGDWLRTEYSLMCADELDNTRSFTADANFDDGKWADWAKSTGYHATACKVFWDAAHAAELVDIKIEEATFTIKTPQNYLKTSDSLKSQYEHKGNREYTAVIKGYVFGDTELDEFRLAYDAKTKKDLRLQWDETASEEKFIDFQNAYIQKVESIVIPAASEAYNVTLTFKAFGADYEGNFENLTNPTTSSRVTV